MTSSRSRPSLESFRRVTFADYQAVLDIDDNVFDGFDYMPSMFYQFMQSHRHIMHICEQNGKAVFFHGMELTDTDDEEKKVYLTFGGRSDKNFRGLGLAYYGLDLGQRYFPDFTEKLGVTSYKDIKNARQCLYAWNSIVYTHLTTSQLGDALKSLQNMQSLRQSPHQLKYADAVDLLHHTDLVETFLRRYCVDYFPAQWHWSAMKIGKRQLRVMFATSNLALVTLDTKTGSVVSPALVPAYSDISAVTSLSYSYIYPGKVGVICDIWYFGDDETLVVVHVRGQLRHLVDVSRGSVGVVIHVPTKLDASHIKQQLRQFIGDSNDSHVLAKSTNWIALIYRHELQAKL